MGLNVVDYHWNKMTQTSPVLSSLGYKPSYDIHCYAIHDSLFLYQGEISTWKKSGMEYRYKFVFLGELCFKYKNFVAL